MSRGIVTVHLWRRDAQALYDLLGGDEPLLDRLWALLGDAIDAPGTDSLRASILAGSQQGVIRIGSAGGRSW